jgi:glycoprotein 3-alpha-L-fucosyltransferase
MNNKSRLNESDYVIVHMRDGIEKIPSFPNRNSKQRWIFVLYESPIHSSNFAYLNGVFNLTATYRLDSNFTASYESQIFWWTNSTDKNLYNQTFDYLKNKTGFATAVISNCGGSSYRLGLINSLKRYIQVDIYGGCGKACPTKYFN